MYLANIADPGTAVYPIHRLIRDLDEWSAETLYRHLSERFEITPCENTLESVKATLSQLGGVFGVMVPGKEAYVLSTSHKTPMDQLSVAEPLRSLDVTVLHGLVLDGILGIDAAKLAWELEGAELFRPRLALEAGDSSSSFLFPTLLSKLSVIFRS